MPRLLHHISVRYLKRDSQHINNSICSSICTHKSAEIVIRRSLKTKPGVPQHGLFEKYLKGGTR